MKHHFGVALVEKKNFGVFPKWPMVVVIALLCLSVAIPSVAQADSAHLRLGPFVFDAPAVNLYVDGAAVMGSDAHASVFGPMTLAERYLDFPAGAHSFAVAPDGGALDSAIISPQELTLEAGRNYLLTMLGNVAANDLHFTLIDETAELAKLDISKSAVTIDINNVYGVPGIDLFFADKLLSNLAYGDYAFAQDPTEGTGTKVTVQNDPTSMLFEFPEAVGSPSNILAVFVFSGKFPGTIWEDYTTLYAPLYVGELTVVDGGAIAVGDLVPVAIPDVGQRVQYTLTLDKTTTLDIVQSASDVTSGADSFARIYNPAGDLLYENDELSIDDNAQSIFDAGWQGLALDAGTYTLEAGTFGDISAGNFTLSVKASP